ncbi:MAG: response regulator [Thermodesulfobacteriota bacterium]
MKILVVDDNQDLAITIQMMLEEEGHEVRLAKDGKDGFMSYLLFRPDIVITDIMMPERNGLELMGDIRTYDPTIRTIYMSGDLTRFYLPLEEEKKRFRANFLEKPFSRFDLVSMLSQF